MLPLAEKDVSVKHVTVSNPYLCNLQQFNVFSVLKRIFNFVRLAI